MQESQPVPEEIEGAAPRTSYDEVPYASHPYLHTHPNRLAVIGTLFGMNPAPVEHCRVLELGCASGGNLIPMAAALPEASFIGIDLSGRQIADGAKVIETLELRNIELRHLSITDVDQSMGMFDYIICHGVWSWVPAPVREKIFEICSQQLSPHGVAYISYNCYPGWHLRGTVRDMMTFHVRKLTKADERVGQARALLDWLVKTVPQNDNTYSSMLRGESDRLRTNADSYVLHEHLEAVNEPVYFYQFAEAAAAKGLKYIAEAQSGVRWIEELPPEAERMVQQLSTDIVEYEQYLDFLRNRMFRRSLVCHSDVPLDRDLDPKRLHGLHVASPAVPQGPLPIAGQDEAKFRVPGGVLSTSDPSFKAALAILGARWPETLLFEDLLELVVKEIAGADPISAERRQRIHDSLGANLTHSYIRAVVELYQSPPAVKAVVGEYPQATAVERYQAAVQQYITTPLHTTVNLDAFGRRVICLANGQRSRAEIFADLLQWVRDGHFSLAKPPAEVRDLPVERQLEHSLNGVLNDLGRLGAFCG